MSLVFLKMGISLVVKEKVYKNWNQTRKLEKCKKKKKEEEINKGKLVSCSKK